MVEDGALSHKIKLYFNFFQDNLNPEGHLNRFIESNVTAILVNGGILHRGGASLGSVCAGSLRSRLVFLFFYLIFSSSLLWLNMLNTTKYAEKMPKKY